MDVTPQQPPADRPVPGPDHSADTAYAPPCESPPALPPDAASLAEPPPASLRTTLRRAAFGVVAGAVLVTGAVVAVPDGDEDAAPPVPGPVSRAMAATAAGSPASLSDLTALIGDRQKWVGTHPSDARSWAVLGSAYVEWGRRASDAAYYTRAEQALKRSLNVEPGERGNEAAWVGLASLANARHDFVTAKKWGETVRSRQPKQWTVYPELVDAYNGLGDYKSATTAVEKYAALRSGVPALGMTADMYRDRGWREDALATAQDAVNRAKTPAEKAACLSRLGELAWERGEPQEAVAQYGAALRTDPAHHPSLAGRARALAALGRTDEAQRDYQAALTKSPRPAYMLELGELYESLGLDGDSVNQYTQLRRALARTKAQGVDDSLLLGRFEAAHGDANAAVELLRAEWGAGTTARRWPTRWAGRCTVRAIRTRRWSTRSRRSTRAVRTRGTRITWAWCSGRCRTSVRPAAIWRRRCAPIRSSRRWTRRGRRRHWTRWGCRRPAVRRTCSRPHRPPRSRRRSRRPPPSRSPAPRSPRRRPGSPVTPRPRRRARRDRRRSRPRRRPHPKRPAARRTPPPAPRRSRRHRTRPPGTDAGRRPRTPRRAGRSSGPPVAVFPRRGWISGGPGPERAVDQRLPRFSCSRSIASKRALKLPLPKPIEPWRSIISKKTVGRSWTGLVKICSR